MFIRVNIQYIMERPKAYYNILDIFKIYKPVFINTIVCQISCWPDGLYCEAAADTHFLSGDQFASMHSRNGKVGQTKDLLALLDLIFSFSFPVTLSMVRRDFSRFERQLIDVQFTAFWCSVPRKSETIWETFKMAQHNQQQQKNGVIKKQNKN